MREVYQRAVERSTVAFVAALWHIKCYTPTIYSTRTRTAQKKANNILWHCSGGIICSCVIPIYTYSRIIPSISPFFMLRRYVCTNTYLRNGRKRYENTLKCVAYIPLHKRYNATGGRECYSCCGRILPQLNVRDKIRHATQKSPTLS